MKKLIVPSITAVLSCLHAAPALAAPHGEDKPIDLTEATQAGGAGGGSFVRTVVGLAVVIGVILGLHWVLKQVKASREESASGSGLTSLATLPLGPNRSLHVVRAGGEILVVGATEHGITPLRAYPEDEARASGLLEEQPEVIEVRPPGRPALPVAGLVDTLRAWTVRR
jgi:flagellar protein FliO/FliZ